MKIDPEPTGYQKATRPIMDQTHPDSPLAEAIIEFAREIQARLSESNDFNEALDHDALCNLDNFLDIHLPRAAVPHAFRRQMDHEGVQLWNMCVQRTLHLEHKRDMKLVCKVKSLAYLMIESVASRQGARSFRVLKMALSAAMACAERHQFDLSQRIIETIAVRLDDLEKSITQHEHPQLQSVTAEYYMLRTYLSWCRGRPDIADHLFSKIPAAHFDKNQGCVLNICYKIGNLALLSHEYHAAVMWLDRALKAYEQLSKGLQGPDITLEEKVLLVAHAFARACLHVGNGESKEPLNRALESLRSRHGDTFAVHILQLVILSAEERFNGQLFLQIVQSAFKTMECKHTHLTLLFVYVHKLRDSNVECYVQALKQLIIEGLVPFSGRNVIELTFIQLVRTLTDASIEVQHNLDVLQDTSQKIIKTLGPLSEEGTHSALILIWKYVDLKASTDDTSTAEKWCSFVLEQSVFQVSLDMRGKFLRKLIICALNNPGTSTLHSTFNKMPTQCQQTPSTLYLMYKHTLSRGGISEASTYLNSLCEQGDQADVYLMPCIGEAIQLGQSLHAAKICERILASPDSSYLKAFDVKNLFQSVLHLLTNIETCDRDEEIRNLQQSVSIFEAALKDARRQEKVQFSSIQLEWLSRRSYNTALRLFKNSQAKSAMQLFGISTKLAEIHQQTLPVEAQPNARQHILLCNFHHALTTAITARKAKTASQKKKHYEDLHNVANYIHASITELNPTTYQEWSLKYRVFLALHFKATIFLQKWNDAATLIEKAGPVTDALLPSIIMDCLLCSDAPVKEMARLVKITIRTLHTSPSPHLDPQYFQTARPRYLRVLFQLSLDAKDDALAESVLDQTLVLVRDAHQSSPSQPSPPSGHRYIYPNEEIQWMSTVGFNRAVEFYRASRDEEFRRWADKAIALADLIDGAHKGELGGLLRRNFAKLI